MSFASLESAITEYRGKFRTRDGCSPHEQVVMATLHNVDVARGCHLSIAMVVPKQVLRSLLRKGLIDDRSRLTRKGDDLLKSWWLEQRK